MLLYSSTNQRTTGYLSTDVTGTASYSLGGLTAGGNPYYFYLQKGYIRSPTITALTANNPTVSNITSSTADINYNLVTQYGTTSYYLYYNTFSVPITQIPMGVITLTGLTINTLYNYYTKIIYSYNVIQQSNTGNSFTTNGNYLNMAYSTRLLNPTYTGAVIRVRNGTNYGDIYTNSSQSTFTMGSFGSTTTYANWIGSNVGYVEIWYDQSGKSNHAYNSTANSSQPLLTSINSTSGNSYYVIKWIKDNSTFLNITTPFIPKTIFCQWQNNNNIFGTFISKNNVGVGLRFDGGTQFSLPVVTQRNDINDFLYHAKDNISVYNNGVNTINGNITTTSYSITNYRCILLQGSTNYNSRMWNICSLSIDSTTLTDVTSYGFNQIGTDSYSNTRSINGYMVEIMCYNHATTDNDMLNYYNSALFNNN